MKKLCILFVTLLASLLFFSSVSMAQMNNSEPTNMPSTPSDDMKTMSDMMTKIKSMRMQRMGSHMVMMAIKMRMWGEYLSKSDDTNTSNQGKALMELSEKVFSMGHTMNPNPNLMPMCGMGMMHSMCPQMMMKMNQKNQ